MGGALLAHTMAGLLDGRRSLTHPPTSFAPLSPDASGRLDRCGPFYRRVVAGKRVLLADDVRNTGETFERAKAVDRGRRAARSSRRPRSTIASRRSSTSACRTSRWPSTARRRTIRSPTVRCARPGRPITQFYDVADRRRHESAARSPLRVVQPSRVRARSDSDRAALRRGSTTARSSRSSRPGSRSAASRRSWRRSRPSAACWARRRRRSSRRSIRRATARRFAPLVHRWTRGDDFVGAAVDPAATARASTDRSSARSPRASIRRAGRRAALEPFSRRARARSICGRPTAARAAIARRATTSSRGRRPDRPASG